MKLVIFGNGSQAEVANYYFSTINRSPEFHVADKNYISETSFCATAVISYEEALASISPETHEIFIAIGYSKLNSVRQEIYQRFKALGFSFASFISDRAFISNSDVGEHAFILEGNVLQPFTKVGNNVVFWSGNHIGHHTLIHSNVFVSSHVVIGGHCSIGANSFLGVNSTIIDGINVGTSNIVGAGALVTRSTDQDKVIASSPSTISKVPSSKIKL